LSAVGRFDLDEQVAAINLFRSDAVSGAIASTVGNPLNCGRKIPAPRQD
jgi:hypothetical protein